MGLLFNNGAKLNSELKAQAPLAETGQDLFKADAGAAHSAQREPHEGAQDDAEAEDIEEMEQATMHRFAAGAPKSSTKAPMGSTFHHIGSSDMHSTRHLLSRIVEHEEESKGQGHVA